MIDACIMGQQQRLSIRADPCSMLLAARQGLGSNSKLPCHWNCSQSNNLGQAAPGAFSLLLVEVGRMSRQRVPGALQSVRTSAAKDIPGCPAVKVRNPFELGTVGFERRVCRMYVSSQADGSHFSFQPRSRLHAGCWVRTNPALVGKRHNIQLQGSSWQEAYRHCRPLRP